MNWLCFLLLIARVVLGHRLVGFYVESSRASFPVSNIDVKSYTVIKYAFLKISLDPPSCTFGPDVFFDRDVINPKYSQCQCCSQGLLTELFDLRYKNPSMKIVISIGGWSWSSNFSAGLADTNKRSAIVNSCVQTAVNYGYDGFGRNKCRNIILDIDWEYPKSPRPDVGWTYSPNDLINVNSFISELRAGMNQANPNRPYLITMEIAGLPLYATAAELKTLSATVDWFNLMSYEFALTPLAKATCHSSPLFVNPSDPNIKGQSLTRDVNSAVTFMLNAGVPADKIVVGIPVYGRAFDGVAVGTSHGLFSPTAITTPRIVMYTDIIAMIENNTCTKYIDSVASAAYAYCPGTQTFITYEDDTAVTAKANYVNTKGLGGMMIWQMANDLPSGSSGSLAVIASQNLKNMDNTPADPSTFFQPKSVFCNMQAQTYTANGKTYNHANNNSVRNPSTSILIFSSMLVGGMIIGALWLPLMQQ